MGSVFHFCFFKVKDGFAVLFFIEGREKGMGIPVVEFGFPRNLSNHNNDEERGKKSIG